MTLTQTSIDIVTESREITPTQTRIDIVTESREITLTQTSIDIVTRVKGKYLYLFVSESFPLTHNI
jgi:hypothetical protein